MPSPFGPLVGLGARAARWPTVAVGRWLRITLITLVTLRRRHRPAARIIIVAAGHSHRALTRPSPPPAASPAGRISWPTAGFLDGQHASRLYEPPAPLRSLACRPPSRLHLDARDRLFALAKQHTLETERLGSESNCGPPSRRPDKSNVLPPSLSRSSLAAKLVGRPLCSGAPLAASSPSA